MSAASSLKKLLLCWDVQGSPEDAIQAGMVDAADFFGILESLFSAASSLPV